jgi:hypothetical protein
MRQAREEASAACAFAGRILLVFLVLAGWILWRSYHGG